MEGFDLKGPVWIWSQKAQFNVANYLGFISWCRNGFLAPDFPVEQWQCHPYEMGEGGNFIMTDKSMCIRVKRHGIFVPI